MYFTQPTSKSKHLKPVALGMLQAGMLASLNLPFTSKARTLRGLGISLWAALALHCLSADTSTSEIPVMTGTEVVSLQSESVGDTFTLYVRVPPQALDNPDVSYPVIYTLDGDHTFPLMCSVTTQLGWSGAVPPAIIVGVGYGTLDLQNGNHRGRDLSPAPIETLPNSGGGEKFLSFLLEEAMPYIEANFPAKTDERYLFGHSLGGLFALYAYSKSPDVFNGIISGSPLLFGQLDLLDQVAADKPARDCRLFVVTGDQEDARFFLDDRPALKAKLSENWSAADRFDMALLPDFDHFTMVAPSISSGLKYVFAQ